MQNSSSTLLHHLPIQPTPLIGRQTESSALQQLLLRSEARLVTLVGPPGIGKTRLAVAVARELLDAFADGVFFVDLVPISHPELVVSTIGQTLGVRETDSRPVVERVKEYLRDRQVLLVLDNFEHVLAASPELAALLASCPHLKLLVTSRAPLHLRAEYQFPVSPLGLPDLQDDKEPELLEGSPAVALFVERARAVKPGFGLSPENVRVVARLCVRLDGLPLAIELAAARIKHLPPQAILGRLEQRLTFLMSTMHDTPSRHRTLRAAIDGSYGLLTPAEQALFRRLAVFRGSFSVESVGAVCPSIPDLLDLLATLVDKSLLRLDEQADGEPRFSMLESIREYARERLEEAGEVDEAYRRLCDWCVAFVERAEPELCGSHEAVWQDRVEREHDNLRATLEWSANRRETERGLRLAGALWWFWYVRGDLTEAREQLARLLAPSGCEEKTAVRAKALVVASHLALMQGDNTAARPLAEESLAIRRELGDTRGVAESLHVLAHAAPDHDVECSLLSQSVALFRKVSDPWNFALALHCLGNAVLGRGDVETARILHEESLERFRSTGNRSGIAIGLFGLGNVAIQQGNLTLAHTLLEQALTIRRELGDRSLSDSLNALGNVALRQGSYQEAGSLFRESLALSHRLGSKWELTFALVGLAEVALVSREPVMAARLLAAVAMLRAALKSHLSPADQAYYDRLVGVVQAALGNTDFLQVWAEGEVVELEQVVKLAMKPMEAPRSPANESSSTRSRLKSPLTRREQEVAILIAHGRTSREIAAELVIAERTVETHVEHILGKLGFHARTQIAAWVADQGLLPPS